MTQGIVLTPVSDIEHNRAYLIVCPHPEDCKFGCAPIDGQHLISQSQWEKIKTDDKNREKFKSLSAIAFGKIKTLSLTE